eukprot:3003256-Pleurochrysis_carterae.AAC.2
MEMGGMSTTYMLCKQCPIGGVAGVKRRKYSVAGCFLAAEGEGADGGRREERSTGREHQGGKRKRFT